MFSASDDSAYLFTTTLTSVDELVANLATTQYRVMSEAGCSDAFVLIVSEETLLITDGVLGLTSEIRKLSFAPNKN